jgi:hypothetical protein
MRFMLALALTLAPLVALAQPAPRLVGHNGSPMAVIETAPRAIRIEYVRPRPGLLAIGLAPGTMLLEGAWALPDLFIGTARVFDPICGAIPYRVQGGIDPAGNLVLRGPAPVLAPWCFIVGYALTDNSTLIFTQLP